MFEDITKQVRERIQRDMKGKFGLTDQESEQSARILLDKVRDFFSEATLRGNLDQLKAAVQDWSRDSSAMKERFNKDVVQDLIQKVGLSEETARRVKDFSMDAVMVELKGRFAEMENKLDLQQLKDKLNPDQLEDSARDLLDQVNKFLKGKS